MFMLDYRSLAWWYWLLSACLLSAGMADLPLGPDSGFLLAIALTVVQFFHFALRERSFVAFPVQVRLGYLLLLLIALPRSLQWIYWLPLVGTWAQVLFGYCLMARAVSLLSWNRKQPFTLALLKRTFISAPVRGNILQGLPPAKLDSPC